MDVYETPNHLASLSRLALERRLVVFCGAGISMLPPSKSPSWWGIYEAAAKVLGTRLREGFPELSPHLDVEALLKPLETQQLADIIVSRFAGDTFVQILKVVDVADPNENHMLLVALAKLGCLRGVITTNFDTLIERTAAVGGFSFAVAAPGIPGDTAGGSSCPLIKIHGSAVDAFRLIETSRSKAGEVAPELAAAWRPILAGSDLLVLGFSGADLSFGAARGFFGDFLESGGHIWWLHQPAAKPRLTEQVSARTTLIEGSLPDFLRDLAAKAGASPFVTPVAGRDAQLALQEAMDAWSKEIHIGRWSAAVFFKTLGALADAKFNKSPLNLALVELARRKAKELAPGEALSIADLSAGSFLTTSGLEALERMETEDALEMLRGAVNLYETVHQLLSKGPDSHAASETERRMNLAASWSNYAQALVRSKSTKDALPAFVKSLGYAYLGGDSRGFLIVLMNILHYGFEFSDVRRSMRILERGVRLADRLGAIQSSIEMRIHLAGHHIARNEIWAASAELAEAGQRAVAGHDSRSLKIVGLLQGHLALKRGLVREGLEAIAELLASSPRTAFHMAAVDEVRKYLAILGSPNKGPFIIDVGADVAALAGKIEAEIVAARERKEIPWEGRHCSTYKSCAFGERDASALFVLGVAEFDGDSQRAIAIGLSLMEEMLDRGLFNDARWIAKNVLANPAAITRQRALAHTALADASAQLGYIEDAGIHLHEAKLFFAQARETYPLRTAEVGLWHSIQSGDEAAATFWALELVDPIAALPEFEKSCAATAERIESWGTPMAAVARTFREAIAAKRGLTMPPPAATPKMAEPFRRFVGTTGELQAATVEAANKIIMEANECLSREEPKRALELIDQVLAKDAFNLPDHQAGLALSIQIHGLSRSVATSELNRVMDRQRESLISQLAFSALSQLEKSLVRVAVGHGEVPLAADILARHSFIGELSDDPRAGISLLFWDARVSALVRPGQVQNQRRQFAQMAASYYGTAEEGLMEKRPTATSENVNDDQVYQTFQQALAGSQQASEADAALAAALRDLDVLNATPAARIKFRGERANWSLQAQRFDEAIQLYLEVERDFRSVGDLLGALNAMAGRARAHGRSGNHQEAVKVFELALKETTNPSTRANLLLGLAAAYLREATESSPTIDLPLVDKSIHTYRDAIGTAALGEMQRALARLGLARALGEKGEQAAALVELDAATAELAHMGSPTAKILIENRDTFVAGNWRALGLQ